MPKTPLFAIVLERGIIQWLVTEDWPSEHPLPRIVVVDYDTNGASDDELTTFSIGDLPVKARCRIAKAVVSESYEDFLSPSAILAAMGQPVETQDEATPLALVRELKDKVRLLDDRLEQSGRSPTGDDYERLHAIVNGWLIEIKSALGGQAD